ncbi:hypothetical protein M1L60_08150 [Actinoplanes sp. TRM 88003]|uniref:Secreted protein n=1 Tax=Paractinoplanes aksuensis TaxID=2939490 RepID=A0ABT1DJB7_9ACTN|nr:hypothetical protein [Actinoplanes aksuensis]MCO8270568.1 hypothetical protein [Actinoplanes aksuensis]
MATRQVVVAAVYLVGGIAGLSTGLAPAAAAPKATIPGTGTYLVNKDFQAGVYRSVGNSACYWQRATDATGATSSIIANDIGDGQRLVYVKPTDKVFKTSGCKTFTRVTPAAMTAKSTRTTIPGNGVYFVGADFTPGTYRSTANKEFCYWERSRSADGASSNIIANEIAQGQLLVTIKPGGVFKTSSCTTWTKVA